ncbi:transforming growth factor beta activator LRRC33-like [Aedes albopictus]|uniref:Membrane glycoprotein lig-1 n=1 Tax=Aedes albopictus TaxID=7160 RepID=A0ABM1ZVY0_AEDAL
MQSFSVWLCFLAICQSRTVDAFLNEGNQRSHMCKTSVQHYDCQIHGVNISEGQIHTFKHEPQKQVITFRKSILHYLPKSLIDAYPSMKLLNLNQLEIVTIEDSAFDNATQLENLFLEGNRLQTLPAKVLNGARKLKQLILTNNDINTITYNFGSNSFLNDLSINGNKIDQLPTFQYIPRLKTFNGSNNTFAHIDKNQFIRQIQIENIDLSHNQLTNLDLTLSSRNLQAVDISNNKLTSLKITLQMEYLNIGNNVLSTLVTNGECLLKSLILSSNKLASQPNFINCQLMEVLDVSKNTMETFEYSEKFENLKELNLAHNNILEFVIPTAPRRPHKLISLDLSHNRLSYLSSLSFFTSLKELRLNSNQFLGIQQQSLPRTVENLFVSNNQWICAEVTFFANIAKDKVTYCNEAFKSVQGICCTDYWNTFNDVLNEIVRHTYFHEQSNYDRLKYKCPQRHYNTQYTYIELIRQLDPGADRRRLQIYQDIANAKESVTRKQNELNIIINRQLESKNFKSSMAILIETKRITYHITREGEIADKEMLSRVINFVRQRDTWTTDLSNRRRTKTENTHTSFNQKIDEKNRIDAIIRMLRYEVLDKKREEERLKKVMEHLQIRVERNNAPLIYGKTSSL